MDLKEFYESMGVDYGRVLNRLRRETLIEKYLHLLLKDENFEMLKKAIEEGDYETAFRAAHSIKGVSLNLDLKPLADVASALVECFRGKSEEELDREKIEELYQRLDKEFERIKKSITGNYLSNRVF